MKKIVFENQPCFGDPNSFLDFMREQQRKPNSLIRAILLLKLGDLEIVYPKEEPLEVSLPYTPPNDKGEK